MRRSRDAVISSKHKASYRRGRRSRLDYQRSDDGTDDGPAAAERDMTINLVPNVKLAFSGAATPPKAAYPKPARAATIAVSPGR